MGKTLIITEQGLTVSVKSGLLTLNRDKDVIEQFKPFELEQLVLMGNIELSNAAVTMVLKNGIDCVFLTTNGKFKGRLMGRQSKNILLRVSQFKNFSMPEFAAKVSGAIVSGKILNQRALLMRKQRNLHSQHLAKAMLRMRVLSRNAMSATSVNDVRTLEAEAARLYFQHFDKMILNPAFFFNGRNRRPPKDPVNACLSFGYTMLQNVVESIVMEVGFDPYLGVLHTPEYGRPSLVLDLMEEFRPIVVDMVTLSLINLRQLTPSDFGPPESDKNEDIFDAFSEDAPISNAIYMKPSGLKIFITAFLKRLRTTMYYPTGEQKLSLRQIIRSQAYLLARVTQGKDQSYQAFTIIH